MSDARFRVVVTTAAVVAALGITGGVLWASAAQPSSAPAAAASAAAPSAAPALAHLARRIPGDPTAIGSVHAPVVMVEFADYRCPFCAAFERDTLPTLIREYVDRGVLRVEWRDFPVFGPQSFDAAVAARAAGEQGRFWQYQRALYALAPRMGHADLTRQVLIDTARKVGVPHLSAFTAALGSARLADAVRAGAAEAQALGASGTPAFVVGSQPLVGAQPLGVFTQVIDQQRKLAGR